MALALKIENLNLTIDECFSLRDVSLTLEKGEILAIVGESGSGKSSLLKSITRLDGTFPNGKVEFFGENVLSFSEKDLREKRGTLFSHVMQNTPQLLNPLTTLDTQLNEVLKRKFEKSEIPHRKNQLCEKLDFPKSALKKRVKQISMGMLQKYLIMTSLALSPKIIFYDEPTSNLDPASAAKFENILQTLKKEGRTQVVVTHDLALAKKADKVAVLYGGVIVEYGEKILHHPKHPYTFAFENSSLEDVARDLWGIKEGEHSPYGCPFAGRCTQSLSKCPKNLPKITEIHPGHFLRCHRDGIQAVIKCENLSKSFASENVLNDISLKIYENQTTAILGCSGAGKTTLLSILSGLDKNYSGKVEILGTPPDFAQLARRENSLQMVFQDDSYLSPHQSVFACLTEPTQILQGVKDENKAIQVLETVGLSKSLLTQKVGTLSQGQKQRLAVARALMLNPKILILDEPTTGLDPSSKANLIRKIKEIQFDCGLTLIIVTHDRKLARKISDRTYLLENGKLKNYTKEFQENFQF